MSARAAATKALTEVAGGRALHAVLPAVLTNTADKERALVQELVYGSLRLWPRLCGLIDPCLSKPLKTKDQDIYCLIIVGVYQLEAMRIPAHAAVSETVATTRKLGKPWAKGLVNAVLRTVQRERDALTGALDIAQQRALPGWLWCQLEQQWPKSSHAIAEAAEHHPPMALRVNRRQYSTDVYQQQLSANDLVSKPQAGRSDALILSQPCDVNALLGFAGGAVSVQDCNAQLAAQLLKPQPGERILDACAAPGGKTGHLLEIADAHVTASDISQERLEKVSDNLARLGLSAVLTELDARNAHEQFGCEQFDAILADVPCSATGVIRRNPDIKVLRTAQDITAFSEQQRAIIAGLWPTLKAGGRLLYVTCSILREENDDVINWALANLDGAQLLELQAEGTLMTRFGLQCLPSRHGGDGLYFAAMMKQNIAC